MSSGRCLSCGGLEFEEVAGAFTQICTACGWVDHDPSTLFHHESDYIPDLTGRDYSSVTALRRSTGAILLKDRYGRIRAMQGADRTEEEKIEATAQRHRSTLFRLIEGTLRQLGYLGVYERAVTLFEQLRGAAQQRADEAARSFGEATADLPVSVTRLNKPIRWGKAANAMAAAAVYGALHREGHKVSLQQVAGAAQQPLSTVTKALYRLKALAGPRSQFRDLSARDRVAELADLTADYFQFWESLLTPDEEASFPVVTKWLRTQARQPARSSSIYKGNLFDRGQYIARDLTDLLLSEARDTVPVTPIFAYAVSLLALEAAARLPLPQKDFVGADHIQAALNFGTSDDTSSAQPHVAGSSHAVKMRYTEVKRCLSDWAAELPWIRALPRISKRSDGESLTRTQLAMHMEDIITLRKPLLAQRQQRRAMLGESSPMTNISGSSGLLLWKNAYSVPSIRDREVRQFTPSIEASERLPVSNSSVIDANDDDLFDPGELDGYLRREEEIQALQLVKSSSGDWDQQIASTTVGTRKGNHQEGEEGEEEEALRLKRQRISPEGTQPSQTEEQSADDEDWEADWEEDGAEEVREA